jgi:hypothetical protein
MTPEQQARAATMASIRHSSELEGGRGSDAGRALQELWIMGDIDADELCRRTQALYGLPPQPGDAHYSKLDQLTADLGPGDAEQVRRFGAFLGKIGPEHDDNQRLAAYRTYWPDDVEPDEAVDPDDEIVTRLADAYLPEALIDLAIATTHQTDEDTPNSHP